MEFLGVIIMKNIKLFLSALALGITFTTTQTTHDRSAFTEMIAFAKTTIENAYQFFARPDFDSMVHELETSPPAIFCTYEKEDSATPDTEPVYAYYYTVVLHSDLKVMPTQTNDSRLAYYAKYYCKDQSTITLIIDFLANWNWFRGCFAEQCNDNREIRFKQKPYFPQTMQVLKKHISPAFAKDYIAKKLTSNQTSSTTMLVPSELNDYILSIAIEHSSNEERKQLIGHSPKELFPIACNTAESLKL